jgi:hypothetical protein
VDGIDGFAPGADGPALGTRTLGNDEPAHADGSALGTSALGPPALRTPALGPPALGTDEPAHADGSALGTPAREPDRPSRGLEER